MVPLFFPARFAVYLRGSIELPSSLQTPNSRCLHVQNEDYLGPCPGSGYVCPFTGGENQSRVQSAVAQNPPRPHCAGNPSRRGHQHPRHSSGRLDHTLESGRLLLQSSDLCPLLVRPALDHRVSSRTSKPLRPPRHFGPTDYPVRLSALWGCPLALRDHHPERSEVPLSSIFPNAGVRGVLDRHRTEFSLYLQRLRQLFHFMSALALPSTLLRKLPGSSHASKIGRPTLRVTLQHSPYRKPLDQPCRDVYD